MALWLHLTLSCDNCGKEEDIVVNLRDDCEHDNKDFCGADCLEIYSKAGGA